MAMELSLDLRDELHAVVADQSAWPDLLVKLANLLGAREATFGGGGQWSKPLIFAPRTDPSYVGIYLETYHQQNTLMRAMMRHSVDKVIAAHALPEFERFQTSDFYHLWCVPQRFLHMFGFSVDIASGWHGTLAINLDTPPSAEQKHRLAGLMPQVRRSVETQILLEQLRVSNSRTLSVLALAGNGGLFLDRHGRVLELNAIAEEMLRSGQVPLREGRLHSLEPQSEQTLSRLLAQCLTQPDHAGGRVLIHGAKGPLAVQVAPFAGSLAFPVPQRPAAIVIIADPLQRMRQRLAELQRVYGLTHAEAELALAVVQAGGRRAAAERRGVTDATARAQLSSIFDKTGVRRQIDLVRLLMGGH